MVKDKYNSISSKELEEKKEAMFKTAMTMRQEILDKIDKLEEYTKELIELEIELEKRSNG